MLLWTPEALRMRLKTIPPVDEGANSSIWWSDHKRQMGIVLGLQARERHQRLNLHPSEFFTARLGATTYRHGSKRRRRTYRQFHGRLADHTDLAALSADAHPRAFLFLDEQSSSEDDVTLWASEPGTASHTHYDAWPNAFTQVHGQKRFLLWAPEAWPVLRLHPHAHPAHRASQLDYSHDVGGLGGCTPRSWIVRLQRLGERLWRGAGETNAEACAVPLMAELHPGDLLFLPAFWSHHVTSLTFSTALSALSRAEEGGRFERACQLGLPASILDQAATATADRERAAAAQRFLASLLLALMPPAEAASYVHQAIVTTRYAPLDSQALRCDVVFGGCGLSRASITDVASASAAEEVDVARRVAGILRPSAAAAQPLSGAAGAPLDGVVHIVLQDYIEHVASFAVGMPSLCGFLTECFAFD